MSDHKSDKSHSSTSTNLSLSFQQLRMKLTSSPAASNPNPPFSPPPIQVSYADTPETASLILCPGDKVDNPLREVYFPHRRVAGPGTTKCIGRPGRPTLSVNTGVPAVSVPREVEHHDAPPRCGPPGLSSAEMLVWLKGPWEEDEEEEETPSSDPFADPEGDGDGDGEGPWFEINVSETNKEAVPPGSPVDAARFSLGAGFEGAAKWDDGSGPGVHRITGRGFVTKEF